MKARLRLFTHFPSSPPPYNCIYHLAQAREVAKTERPKPALPSTDLGVSDSAVSRVNPEMHHVVFTLFPRFPVEMRLKIWKNASSTNVGARLAKIQFEEKKPRKQSQRLLYLRSSEKMRGTEPNPSSLLSRPPSRSVFCLSRISK
jgi:hypothetical protein